MNNTYGKHLRKTLTDFVHRRYKNLDLKYEFKIISTFEDNALEIVKTLDNSKAARADKLLSFAISQVSFGFSL